MKGKLTAECGLWASVGLMHVVLWIAFCVLLVPGCGQPVVYTQPMQQPVVVQQPQYQVIQDPNTGAQYSVFYDNGIQQMVELSLFMSWMRQPGGFTYVINHYHDNPSYYRRYDRTRYSSWRSTPSPTFRSTTSPPARSNTPVFRSTTAQPAARPTFNSSSTRSSSTPTFRSSSPSPSRSSSPSFRSSRH